MTTLRQRRAAGQVGTAAFLAGLERHTRPIAERVAPPPDARRLDQVRAAAEIRRTVAAMRVLPAYRQLRACQEALAEEPDEEARARLIEHVARITRHIGDVERAGTAPRLPYALLVEQERDLPDRRPRSAGRSPAHERRAR